MQKPEVITLLQQNPFVYSFSILITFFLIAKLVVYLSKTIILKLTKKTKTDIDDLIVKRTNGPLSLILILIGIRLALLPLNLRQNLVETFGKIILSLITLLLTYMAIIVLDIVIDGWGRRVAEKTKSAVDNDLLPLVHKFSRIFLSIIGLLFVLPVWGIQVGPLLASLGIAGIAVAFALQSTLGNIFGGVSIIADKSVKVGDKIKIDAETMGTVVEVGLRSTKIKSWDNELITVPNGKLADAKILNFTQPDPTVRVSIDFGVEYGSDTAKVKKIALDTIKKIPNVIEEPAPKVNMMEMSDFALKFRVLFFVNNFDVKFDTKSLATEEIYNALRKAGIGIPFPTRTVYLKDSP